MLRPTLLRAAVSSQEKPQEIASVSGPGEKDNKDCDGSLTAFEKVFFGSVMITGFFLVWFCAALIVFGIRYGSTPERKIAVCDTCSGCSVHDSNIKRVVYWDKNRVTPREFYPRFWGAMCFFRYPELLEHRDPEWTPGRDDLNPSYWDED